MVLALTATSPHASPGEKSTPRSARPRAAVIGALARDLPGPQSPVLGPWFYESRLACPPERSHYTIGGSAGTPAVATSGSVRGPPTTPRLTRVGAPSSDRRDG